MSSPNEIILIYAMAWLGLFVLFYGKNRMIGVPGIILLTYGFAALTSIFFYQNNGRINNITQEPFIFVFICMCLCVWPFLKKPQLVASLQLRNVGDRSGVVRYFLIGASPFVLYTFLELFVLMLTTNTSNLDSVYESDVSVTVEKVSFLGQKIIYLVSFFTYAWPILFFLCVSKKGVYKKLAFVAFCAYSCQVMEGFVNAHRVTIVRLFIYFFVVFYFFRNDLSDKFKHKFYFVSAITLSACVLLLSLITIARFNSMTVSIDLKTWVSLYTGEGILRFSQYAWDLTKTTDGDTCFCFFKKILGMDTFTNLEDRRLYYESRLGIPTRIFYTYIGDICIDFGKKITIAYAVLSGLLLNVFLFFAKKKFTLMKLAILSLLVYTYLFGFMYCSFKVYAEQLNSLICIVLFGMYDKLETRRC